MRIAKFYDVDPRRRDSDEVRFGDDWRSAARKGAWSVFWIHDTGELVAYQTAHGTGAHGVGNFLGDVVVTAMSVTADRLDEEVTVLFVDHDETSVRDILDGWEQHVDTPDGFTWLLDVTGRAG